MKTASRIILLVAAIESIIAAVTFLILGLVFIYLGISTEAKAEIIRSLENGMTTTSFTGTYEEQATAIQAVFAFLGVFFLIYMFLTATNGVMSFIARTKFNKPTLIISLVLGFVSLMVVNSVGSILGLVAESQAKIEW